MLVSFTVSRNDAGQRADRYLRGRLSLMSLDRLNSLFRRKEIKVGKKPILRGYLLSEGDDLKVFGLKPEESPSVPSSPSSFQPSRPPRSFSIPILHEDEDILVLDKPSGLAVHPGTGIRPGDSVIERVRERLLPQGNAGDLFRPSLVHRLDKDTSGVLLVAKSGEALRRFGAALREGGFVKRYLALVEGHMNPASGILDARLMRVDSREGGAKALIVASIEGAEGDGEEGKDALTHYHTVKSIGNFSLLSVIIETGRMHQIRAHMAHAGHPLIGDSRYGSHEKNRAYREGLGLKRIFLHAAALDIVHDREARLSYHAPLPPDLSRALELLPEFAGPSA